jgi:protein-S-isoprenylcysteine O-methyltransferase Ste14
MDELLFRRAVVLASAVVYWVGVWIQIRRVRQRIGRSPNVSPRGTKERLLWGGWMLVVAAWIAQPILAGSGIRWAVWQPMTPLLGTVSLVLGLTWVGAGYAGTLWCYASMGDTWRMGIKRTERTRLVTQGLYSRVRHPIYLLQLVMLAGSAALHPSPLSFGLLVVHFACVWVKASDEESYLVKVHGDEYRAYLARTGRLFPRLRSQPRPSVR